MGKICKFFKKTEFGLKIGGIPHKTSRLSFIFIFFVSSLASPSAFSALSSLEIVHDRLATFMKDLSIPDMRNECVVTPLSSSIQIAALDELRRQINTGELIGNKEASLKKNGSFTEELKKAAAPLLIQICTTRVFDQNENTKCTNQTKFSTALPLAFNNETGHICVKKAKWESLDDIRQRNLGALYTYALSLPF